MDFYEELIVLQKGKVQMTEHEVDWSELTAHEMLAGGIAGLSEHVVMFPFDTIKTRMQENPALYPTTRQTFTRIVKNEPLRHFYRGCGPTVSSAFPAHAAYFGVYEAMKRFMSGETTMTYVCSAAMATLAHDAVTLPFDVVKQRMQVDNGRSFTSAWACLQRVVRTSGLSSLFRALPATAAMNVPHAATHWVVYEGARVQLIEIIGIEDVAVVISGLCAGAAAAVASTPLDNIKTQIQLGQNATGTTEAFRWIMKNRGVGGFTKGAWPRVCSMAPSAAIVMFTYETTKRLLGTASFPTPLPPTSIMPPPPLQQVAAIK